MAGASLTWQRTGQAEPVANANHPPLSPLFILSVSTGYGDAERNIELMLPYLAADRPVVIFACNPHHLTEIQRLNRPGLDVHRVDAGQDGFADAGARLVLRRYLALHPAAILATTLDSLRILSQVARSLPGIDAQSYFYVRDARWLDDAALLEPLGRATMLVPDRSLLDRPSSVSRFVWPHGPIRSLVLPDPLDLLARDVAAGRLGQVLDGGWSVPPSPVPAPIAAQDEARLGALLFDVSLSLEMGWHLPVGMSRVETHVADALACRSTPVTLLCRNTQTGDYRRLDPRELEFLANRTDGIGALAGRALAILAPPPARPPFRSGRTLMALGFLSIANGGRFAGGRLGRWLQARASRAVRPLVCVAPLFAPQPGDRLISVSNPWDYVSAATFADLRAKGVRYDLVVHDLMVWDTPYWTAGRDPQDYARNMLAALAGANRLVCVSRATAAVTERALAEIGAPAPPISVAHPAGLSPALVRRTAPPQAFDLDRPFVLYCSTIEVRKNHLMLLTLWEKLRQTLPPERLPRLIIAGRWGWGIDTVRLMIERNWRLAPHVQVFEDLSDENLSWLYRNARFSVFPSFTEGFGLPVAESLAVGTPVVVSTTPALIEAAQSLMPALDPHDLPAWQREITALCLDEARLDHLRQQARLYRPAQPEDLPRVLLSDSGVETS